MYKIAISQIGAIFSMSSIQKRLSFFLVAEAPTGLIYLRAKISVLLLLRCCKPAAVQNKIPKNHSVRVYLNPRNQWMKIYFYFNRQKAKFDSIRFLNFHMSRTYEFLQESKEHISTTITHLEKITNVYSTYTHFCKIRDGGGAGQTPPPPTDSF